MLHSLSEWSILLLFDIRDDQVLDISVVAAAHIVGIGFVKAQNSEMIRVKRADIVGVFDDQDEPRPGLLQHSSQPFLIILMESPPFVIGKVGVVGWIEKHEIPFGQTVFGDEIGKVGAASVIALARVFHVRVETITESKVGNL